MTTNTPAPDGARMAAAYRKVDAMLVARGAPSTSDTLRAALETFWLSGKFRMVMRKGRQVGWSTIVTPRVLATTVLAGVFNQARGTRGTIAHFSTRQKEADERLYNDERVFADLGIKCKVRGDTLEIPGRPVVVQSFPATSDVARGSNFWAVFEDEMPAWRDNDGANPAKERDGAIVPACIMHPNARVYSGGTPMGTVDYHAKLVTRGDTDGQCVFVGPSWYWNPTLTEARCRQIEPDERMFLREYAAIPQSDDLVAVDVAALSSCVRAIVAAVPVGSPIAFIDTSGGKGDTIAWMVASWANDPATGRKVLRVSAMGALEGATISQAWSVDNVAAHVAATVKPMGVSMIVGDQFGAWGWMGAFARVGLVFRERPWTNESKTDAVVRLRQILKEGSLAIEPGPEADALIREAANFREKIQPSGAITFAASRGHDDRMMTLLLAARVDAEGGLSGSTLGSAATSVQTFVEMNQIAGRVFNRPRDVMTIKSGIATVVGPGRRGGW